MGNVQSHLSLEIPRFGEFARQHAVISTRDLEESLAIQRRQGGRLGHILVERKLLDPHRIVEILRAQARWASKMRSHDVRPRRFPLETPFSLCLPCFNEAATISDTLTGACAVLPEFVRDFEIVVVDDGSSDDTAEIVRHYSGRDDRIRLVRHEKNRGYGASVATGLRAADGEIVCFTDGDGQFNLLDLPQLLAELDCADVVIGYRYKRADNALRSLNSHAWKTLIRLLLGVRVRDLDCAFKLFPRSAVDAMQLNSAGACISAEIMTQCQNGGLEISEVPVNHFPRSAGQPTGANLRVILKAFRELPTLWKYRKIPPLDINSPARSFRDFPESIMDELLRESSQESDSDANIQLDATSAQSLQHARRVHRNGSP